MDHEYYYVTPVRYDSESWKYVPVGEPVSLDSIAKAMTTGNMAALLDDYCNSFSSSFERGKRTGHILRMTHRTLQRSVIVELVGIIAGLSEQDYTDDRNRQAIALAKEIVRLLEGIIAGLSEQDDTDDRNRQAIALAKEIVRLYENQGAGQFV